MKRYRPALYLLLWVLLFAGRAPEPKLPEAKPSAKPVAEVVVPTVAPEMDRVVAHGSEGIKPLKIPSQTFQKEQSIRYHRRMDTSKETKSRWLWLLGPLGGLLSWRWWKRNRNRVKPTRRNRTTMASWLKVVFAILAFLVVFTGGMLACAGILGITWAAFGWMVAAIICALILGTGIVLLGALILDKADFQLPRNIIARLAMIVFVIFPLFICGGLILIFLGFLLFLNVFLIPPIGLTLALGVMGTTLGTLLLGLSVVGLITGDIN